MMSLFKVGVLLFWIAYLLNYFGSWFGSAQGIIFWSGKLLLLAHLIEYLIKRKQLTELGQKPLESFAQTMLFGFLYWQPLLRRVK